MIQVVIIQLNHYCRFWWFSGYDSYFDPVFV